jgi:hypothetical protein
MEKRVGVKQIVLGGKEVNHFYHTKVWTVKQKFKIEITKLKDNQKEARFLLGTGLLKLVALELF